MGVVSGGRGPWLPWTFMHGTDVVDRGLIVLFFGHFCYFSDFAIFRSIFRCSTPPGNFSADALA